MWYNKIIKKQQRRDEKMFIIGFIAGIILGILGTMFFSFIVAAGDASKKEREEKHTTNNHLK